MGLMDIFKSKPKPATPQTKYFMEFDVAGIYYYEKDVKRVMKRNPRLDSARKTPGARVYLYERFSGPCKTVPEPNNRHDPNAVMIIVNDRKIGHCPADQAVALRSLITTPTCAKVEIFGGDYQEYDGAQWRIIPQGFRAKVSVWQP